MNYLLSFLIGYLIGSFPTAYILIKRKLNVDITKSGSGNVGALNSFRVSKSKLLGVSVFIIDLSKGLLSVIIVKNLIGNEFSFAIISLFAAVFAHCFSVWINFKGGRGLATAAGGSIIISIPILLIWFLFWSVTFVINKNIHFASIVASIFTVVLSWFEASFVNKFTSPHANTNFEFTIFITLIFCIIILKHVLPFKDIENQMFKNLRKDNV